MTLVVEVWAFVHVRHPRADAFRSSARGPRQWLRWVGAVTAGAACSRCCSAASAAFSASIAIGIALVYLLDVRPALRDAVDGHGYW